MTIIWYYLIAAAIVVLDQATKLLAVRYLQPMDTFPLWNGVLHLTYVENTGAAFGMMKNSRWIFMTASIVAVVALVIVIAKYAKQYRFACVCLAMILGGGIGNMIDRVALGHVVDFIDFRLINFAVFNGADSFICIGAFLLILYLLSELMAESRASRATAAEKTDIDKNGVENDAENGGENDGDYKN